MDHPSIAVRLKGKGNVVRTIFRDVDADILLMVDGDDTYSAGSASLLLDEVASGRADMAVGARLEQHAIASFRAFHGVGNRLVGWTISRLFGHVTQDPLSGCRAISRPFARSMPVLSMGFEIETEMTVFGLMNGLTVSISRRLSRSPGLAGTAFHQVARESVPSAKRTARTRPGTTVNDNVPVVGSCAGATTRVVT